ncbi:hypothetical protein RUND412_004803 [Rhizina undulata]
MPILIPTEYGYVLSTIAASAFVAQWHGFLVGGARKAAQVPYPNAYASHEEATKDPLKFRFNCTQRAHQNFLENYPVFLATMLITGLKYPILATSLGSVWLVGRVAYALGYRASSPESGGTGRYKGVFFMLGHMGLMFSSAYVSWQISQGI